MSLALTDYEDRFVLNYEFSNNNCKKKTGIYQIEINGGKYIGSTTVGFMKRWRSHIKMFRRGIHDNIHMNRAYVKYIEKLVTFTIIEIIDNTEDIIKKEQYYIDKIIPEYNICRTAGNCLGVHPSEETRLKMSKKSTGRKHTQEAIELISKGNKGKKRTEETRLNISESAKIRWSTPEARLILSERAKGKIPSEETRIKLSICMMGRAPTNKGIPHSESTKNKMREARKNYKFTEEQIEKLVIANGNKKYNKIIAIQMREGGKSYTEIAGHFGVSYKTVYRHLYYKVNGRVPL